MKECPNCGNQYSDATQLYCLDDGSPLIDSKEQETVDSIKTEPKSGSSFLFGVLTAFLVLLLVGGGILGWYFLVSSNQGTDSSTEVSNSNKEEETLGDGFSSNDSLEKKTYVNSPNDGFLALRSKPNHRTGKLLAKIPHNQEIVLSSCGSKTRIGRNAGSWCKTTYKEINGWVFDAWTVTR